MLSWTVGAQCTQSIVTDSEDSCLVQIFCTLIFIQSFSHTDWNWRNNMKVLKQLLTFSINSVLWIIHVHLFQSNTVPSSYWLSFLKFQINIQTALIYSPKESKRKMNCMNSFSAALKPGQLRWSSCLGGRLESRRMTLQSWHAHAASCVIYLWSLFPVRQAHKGK